MLTIWTNKIKHSTVGSSFSVTFSVAPNELEYLNKLYDCFNSMNWSSFPITADRKTEPTISKMEQVDKDINVRSKDEPQIIACPINERAEYWFYEDEPQVDGILFKGDLKEGEYKLIKTTDGWVLANEEIVYCGWERRSK